MKICLAENSRSHLDLYKPINDADKRNPEPYLAFLRPTTLTGLQSKFSVCKGLSADKRQEAIDSGLDLKFLRDYWRKILVDAIYFLRINDHREVTFYETTDKEEKERIKTCMHSRGVEDAAEASVYGVKDLANYFAKFTAFESTLYGVDKYYRDHIAHPFNVWLTGLNIIGEYGSRFNITSSCARIEDASFAQPKWFWDEKENRDIRISTAELSAMWAIIALTHDIGYPLEKVDKINDQLETMLSQFGNIGFSRSHFSFENQHDHLVKFLIKLISSVVRPIEEKNTTEDDKKRKKTEEKEKETEEKETKITKVKWVNYLRTKYYTKFSKSWEQFDHGIVSCLLLLKTLTFFIESDYADGFNKPLDMEDARQFTIRTEILHAIASHTTPKIYHLLINNLSFLLVFCDDIQEWSRPTLSDIRAGIKGSAKSVVIENISIGSENEINEVECLIKYEEQEIGYQERFINRTFTQWLERLRPAMDDAKRTFKYTWKIQFGDDPAWSLILDSSEKDVFSKIKIDGLTKDKHPDQWSLARLAKLEYGNNH